MIFKKNGRLYGDIESLLNECCEINQYCFQCALHGKVGTKSCAGYAAENPEEVARLLDATVIKGKPIIAEAVEENSEDVKRKLTRADILHAAEKCVCGQREQDYGTPEDNFKAIAELWSVYLDRISVGKYGNMIVDEKDVAVMMALLKIARIAAGGGKADSWIDLAGYAACGAECEGVTE